MLSRTSGVRMAHIADISPDPPRHGLLPGQHRHRGVVAVQPLGAEHMSPDGVMQGAKRDASSSYPVGQGRDVDLDALGGHGPALPGERQVHGELVADDHRQQARAGAPARDGMVRRRRLGDGLAGPAAELLPHRLHHLPLPGHHLQRLRDVFPQLDQITCW